MSYLIDGNNLMGKRVADSVSRRKLLDELAQFVVAKRVSMAVVFDGAPEDFFPDGATYRGMKIFYALRGSNADERIKAMIEASRERRTLRVVTSDRALADYAGRCGAHVIGVKDFRNLMREAQTSSDSASEHKREIKSDELNGWMRYFGVAPEDDN
jgi:predicted RNA-binding protein with PIN domain